MRVAWVYKRVDLLAEHAIEPKLRELGEEGWELAAFEPPHFAREPRAVFKRSIVMHDRPPETEVTKLFQELRKTASFLAKRNLDGNEGYAVEEARKLGKLVLDLIGEQ